MFNGALKGGQIGAPLGPFGLIGGAVLGYVGAKVVIACFRSKTFRKIWKFVSKPRGGSLGDQISTERTAQAQPLRTSTAGTASDPECTCHDVFATVLYANINGMKSATKDQQFCQIIQNKSPDIVALVETKLTSNDQINLEDWGLQGYSIFRFDRCEGNERYTRDDTGRGGGGMLVAIKIHPTIQLAAEVSERYTLNYNDNLRNFMLTKYFKCAVCNQHGTRNYSFRLVYRRPGPFRQSSENERETHQDFAVVNAELVSLILGYYQQGQFLGHIGYKDGVILGDFNWTREEALREFGSWATGLEAMDLDRQTTDGGSPDMVFGTPGFVVFIETLDFISDHRPLYFTLRLGKDYEIKCDRCG